MDLEVLRNKRNQSYNIAIEWLKNNIDNPHEEEVRLLMQQYHYGIGAKNDLYYKLVQLGIMD